MAEGIEVEVENGFAHIQFLDPAKKGPALTELLALGGPGMIEVDTRSNPRKTYIVPEGTAREAGLLDGEAAPEPVPDAPAAAPEGAPSDAWTVAQLTDYAKREEIDLGGATKKADILAAIQAANNPAPAAPEAPAQE